MVGGWVRRLWRTPPKNPNDLWEAFPDYMRGKAYVELYMPINPHTGRPYPNTKGAFACNIVCPLLIPPEKKS